VSTHKKIQRRGIHTALTALSFMATQPVWAEALNTQLPTKQEEGFSVPVNVDIPAQPLANSLHDLGKATGMNISFPNDVVSGKTAPEVRGRMTRKEALQRVLGESGLVPKTEGNNIVIQKPPKEAKKDIQLDKVEVRAKRFYEVGPLPGLGLTKEQIPGNVQSISAKEIKESHSLSITDLMNRKLQSVNVNDYQGNPFQMDVTYRGFTAGPQIGTPQGLSVFIDGIRVNEPFGDVVNWDMIPMNALSSVDVFPGSNPIFGLNTLGGAFSMKTKDGFNNAGADAQVLTGSFGRKQLQAEGGWNNGTIGLFAAGNFFLEDGWRENSPSRVNQMFAKASYRGDKLDLNFSTLLVQTKLVGNGLYPSEMYAQDRNGSYTAEDTTKNKLQQFQLSGSYFVNDSFTVTGQLYRRDSERIHKGADVYTQFGDKAKNRDLKPGEEYTCVYQNSAYKDANGITQFGAANKYGLPNYFILNIPDPANDSAGFFTNEFLTDYYFNKGGMGAPDYGLSNGAAGAAAVNQSFNGELPDYFANAAINNFKFWQNFDSSNYSLSGQVSGDIISTQTAPNGEPLFIFNAVNFNSTFAEGGLYATGGTPNTNSDINPDTFVAYYYDVDSNGNLITDTNGNYTKHAVVFLKPDNAQNCATTQLSSATTSNRAILAEKDPVTGQIITVDGLYQNNGQGTGVVEGTPTAVFNDGKITQLTNGGSVQLNWNLPKHKFMIGASIDSSDAEYANQQTLGMLDSTRKAYLAPDQIRDEYAAKILGVNNNDFSGTSMTKSLYASETWSPIETLHLSGAVRYNATHTSIKLASRRLGDQFNDISNFYATPDSYAVANNGVRPETGYKIPDLAGVLAPPEREKHSYYSLNPSVGASWQARESLNFFGNVAQGTRTPSVIELGCAFDHTLIDYGPLDQSNPNGPRKLIEKSIAENRSCSLPTTLSGDPHLPQIKATTYDIGVRGSWAGILGAKNIDWNLGFYRTDLKDDIYMVTYPGNRNFFDTIGQTRRQGIEAGINADFGKTTLRLNYALTDATFQSTFDMAADDNSSAIRSVNGQYCNSAGTCIYNDPEDDVGRIRVKPGDRMPGIPLHNMNATLSYEVTPEWQVGLNAVAHSGSFLRGNENNEHQQGQAITVSVPVYDANGDPTGAYQQIKRQPASNPGKISGYATFNLFTSYKISKEWTASLIVNNVFDKEYFSAGRLGRNPFSPSIYGAKGPDGYNHNSGDWLSTNFLAPGAPRGIWFSLNWHFVPD
jgi:outer membrane receptor for Fe3+-dicitrate